VSLISDLWILVTWRLKEASYWEAPQMLAELISSAILYYLLQKKNSSTLSNSIQSLINKSVTYIVTRFEAESCQRTRWSSLRCDTRPRVDGPSPTSPRQTPSPSTTSRRTPNTSSRYVIWEYLHSNCTSYKEPLLPRVLFTTQWTQFLRNTSTYHW